MIKFENTEVWGFEHALRGIEQIFVSVDITAPLYWWKEFDTYKVGMVANSCSTMHTIHKKKFTLEDFSCEHLLSNGVIDEKRKSNDWDAIGCLMHTIDVLNYFREHYLRHKDRKYYWWQMIQLLPSSYNQMRTVTLNYENLRSIYFQRKAHKLDEWRDGFCDWVKGLPYSKELIIFDPNEPADEKVMEIKESNKQDCCKDCEYLRIIRLGSDLIYYCKCAGSGITFENYTTISPTWCPQK